MLKSTHRQNDEALEAEGVKALRDLLERIPFAHLEGMEQRSALNEGSRAQPDIVARLTTGEETWQLAVECKREGQPRRVREAALQLTHYLSRMPIPTKYGLVLAPFISERSADVCQELGVGFLDLAGNCRLSFDHVFIERRGAENPFRVRRDLRSLFTPKAGRVLRVLLEQPSRPWKVTDLQAAAGVSLGHVSNVRKRLLDHEWAAADATGLRLTNPADLLRAWQRAYEPRVRAREKYHTVLHGERLDAAVRAALAEAGNGSHAMLASFSAARWLAPHVRQATTFFYADSVGADVLQRHLQLEPASKGENIVIDHPREDDVFAARLEPAPGIWCSGLVQTWLDLSASGERGREAAEHLLRHKLQPAWKDAS